MIWLSETNAVKLTMTGGDSLLAAVATAATAATASCLTLGGGARVVSNPASCVGKTGSAALMLSFIC